MRLFFKILFLETTLNRKAHSTHNAWRIAHSAPGFAVIAAIIAVFVLGALGLGIAYFSSYNQQLRIQQVTGDQAFYSSQFGMEFALGQIITDGWSGSSVSREFSGETVNITRTAGKINVSSAEQNARSLVEINDPNPPSGDCLNVDTTGAGISNRELEGLTLSRDASCSLPLTITAMSGTTWEPDLGEGLVRVRIAGNPTEFSGSAASGGSVNFSNNYTINDFAAHNITDIRWSTNMSDHNFTLHFHYTYDGSDYEKVVDVNFLADNQAACFQWNTGSARLTWNSSLWSQLTGTTVQNTCAEAIILDKMTVSWTPTSPSSNLNTVRIDGTNIYGGSAGSGVLIDISNDLYAASSTYTANYFAFDADMLGRNYSIIWTFVDGTSKATSLDLFNASQQNCLTIDTSSAVASGTNILGLTIENTCAADIGMTGLTMSWSGEGGRRLQQSIIEDTDGSNTYSSNASSGTLVSFGDNGIYLRDGDGARDITSLGFNNTITPGLEFTLEFTMSDGTTKSVTFTPTSSTQADFLSVDISGANIGGGSDKDLRGITITNTGSSTITWDRVIVSWTPTSPSRTLSVIRVSNSNVWTGSASSGSNLNISNVTLSASQTRPITRIRFNSDMSGRTFNITFIMSDGSTKSTGNFTPPDG
ncbi:MAG: hypothetical protein ABIE74_09750 [Pseudomonadota bacterium]